MMNVHHLELFYQVAHHRGISEAVRNMPYGIQQPAVSGQLLQLEESLGVKLFNRRPFALTPAGDVLYQFISPFFGNLEAMQSKLSGEVSQHLRIAASGIVLRDHLPLVFQALRRKFPGLRLTLREATPLQALDLLQTQEVDLSITVIEGRTPAGFRSVELVKLPMVLLVGDKCRHQSAAKLLADKALADEPLITLPPSEPLAKILRAELARRRLRWPSSIEVNSLDLIQTYVARGFGIGHSVAMAHPVRPASVRMLPLRDFPPLVVGAIWQGRLAGIAGMFLELVKTRAREIAGRG